MKKILIIALIAIAFVSCTKQRVDEPRKKDVYKTYYFRVDGIEDAGKISTNIVPVKVKQN